MLVRRERSPSVSSREKGHGVGEEPGSVEPSITTAADINPAVL